MLDSPVVGEDQVATDHSNPRGVMEGRLDGRVDCGDGLSAARCPVGLVRVMDFRFDPAPAAGCNTDIVKGTRGKARSWW